MLEKQRLPPSQALAVALVHESRDHARHGGGTQLAVVEEKAPDRPYGKGHRKYMNMGRVRLHSVIDSHCCLGEKGLIRSRVSAPLLCNKNTVVFARGLKKRRTRQFHLSATTSVRNTRRRGWGVPLSSTRGLPEASNSQSLPPPPSLRREELAAHRWLRL